MGVRWISVAGRAAVVLLCALAVTGDASAAVGYSTIYGDAPNSKLTKIHVGEDLSFQVSHRSIPGKGQFYPSDLDSPADMGVMVRMNGVLYAPNFRNHGGSAAGLHLGTTTSWAPVSFGGLSGDGSLGSPYSYTVVANAGTSGLRVAMVVTYVNAENFFRHNLTFTNTNTGGEPLSFDVFIGSDIYIANSDLGIPQFIPSSGSVGGTDCDTGDYTVLHIPITPADHWTAKRYQFLWGDIRAGDLDDTIATGCIDDGAALEWTGRTLGAGEALTIESATSFGEIPTIADPPPYWCLFTVTDQNELAAVNVAFVTISGGEPTFSATSIIGLTQDNFFGPPRRIRGLAYGNGLLYGMTREGDLLKVNPSTGQTSHLYSLPFGDPSSEFWSGLAFDGTNKLYTANTYGNKELVEIALATPEDVDSATVIGNTYIGAVGIQVLGMDFYPSSAPMPPPTFDGIHPSPDVLYGSNRGNHNIVVVDTLTAAVTMPFGNHVADVFNYQAIAFHPTTGILFAIYDHFSVSNNAALSSYDFAAERGTELGQLPFGIVETVGGGNDTYGWGGLAFAPSCTQNLGPVIPIPAAGSIGVGIFAVLLLSTGALFLCDRRRAAVGARNGSPKPQTYSCHTR